MKTKLFLGQGCGNLHQNPLVGRDWLNEFDFIPAPTGDMQVYAEGWAQYERKVVGHSLGCLTALAVLARAKKVEEAVLLCSAPLPTDFFPLYIQMAMVKFGAQHPREFVKMLSGKDFHPSDDNWREMLFNGLTLDEIEISMQYRTSWHGYHVKQSIKSAFASLVGLSKFSIDSLKDKQIVCVGCELDQMIRPSVTRGIAKKLGARHVEIPNAGHMLMLGKDADLNLKLLHHLNVL